MSQVSGISYLNRDSAGLKNQTPEDSSKILIPQPVNTISLTPDSLSKKPPVNFQVQSDSALIDGLTDSIPVF